MLGFLGLRRLVDMSISGGLGGGVTSIASLEAYVMPSVNFASTKELIVVVKGI
jgi:hypothetical protein